MPNNSPDQTLVIEFTMSARKQNYFQGLLQAEDGLGVVRCFDPEKKRQQLWTSAMQREKVFDWLESLPETIDFKILGQWYWDDKL